MIASPVFASHIFAVLPHDPVTIREPSLLNDAAVTWRSCPERVMIASPVIASHIFAVLSDDPVTMRAPSGLKDAAYTLPSCPVRIRCREEFTYPRKSCARARSVFTLLGVNLCQGLNSPAGFPIRANSMALSCSAVLGSFNCLACWANRLDRASVVVSSP